MGSIATPSGDLCAENAMLRAFLDFVAEAPYSRTLQVMACHLRAAMLDESGLSHLSVSDLARVIDAPVTTVKTSHRRLTKDGVLARTQVLGGLCSTSIIIPNRAHPTSTETPENVGVRDIFSFPPTTQVPALSAAPLADVIPRAQARDDSPPVEQAPSLTSDQGDPVRDIFSFPPTTQVPAPSAAPLADVISRAQARDDSPPVEQAPSRLTSDQGDPERKPTPPGLRQLMSTLRLGKKAGDHPDGPELTPSTDVQPTPTRRAKLAAAPIDKQPGAVPIAQRPVGKTRVFPKIERAVAEAVMGAERTDTYPDTGNLAAEVVWTLFNGVYRDLPMEKGLRICLLTIRRGTWLRPKAYSPTEANSLRCK